LAFAPSPPLDGTGAPVETTNLLVDLKSRPQQICHLDRSASGVERSAV